MATLIGVVSQVVGEVFAVAGDGARRPLVEGDRVYAGEQIVTGASGAISVAMTNGQQLTLGRDSSLTLNEQMLASAPDAPPPTGDTAPAAPSDSELTDVERLQAAIEAGVDPTLAGEATAAGPGAGGAGGAGAAGGGHSFVLLGETGGALDPVIGFPTEGLGSGPEFPNPDPTVLFDEPVVVPDFTPEIEVVYDDPSVDTGVGVVEEAALGNGETPAPGDGSNPDSLAETTTGQLIITSPDGVSSVQVQLQVQNIAGEWIDITNGGTVQGQYGFLTFDGAGNWDYTIEVSTVDHNIPGATGADDQVAETFAVRVIDNDGDISPAAPLTILINDDGPTALDDTAVSVAEDAVGTIGGAVLDNDTRGADGATLTSVNLGDGNGFQAIAALGTTLLSTANGTYTFTSAGAWTFDPTSGVSNAAGVSAGFTYTLTDGDGDTDTAVQPITVTDGTGPVAGDPISLVVDDQNLSDGSSPATPVTDDGSITFTPGSDAIASIMFSDDLGGLGGGLTWSRESDSKIVGKDGGVTIVTLSLGVVANVATVTATLADNYDSHPGINLDDLQDLGSVTVVATDTDGDFVEGTVDVSVSDDVPSVTAVVTDENAIRLNTQDAETIAAASDTASANFSGAFTVGSSSYGADGAGTTTWSYSLNLIAASGADSGLKSDGNTIYLYDVSGVIVGSTSATAVGVTAGNTVFSLSVNGTTGVVTLTQAQEIDHALPGASSNYDAQEAVLGTDLVGLKGTVTITDGDGDTDTDEQTLDLGGNVVFDDDGPVVSANAAVQLDDDALAGGNPGGIDDDANAANTSGTLGHSFGADGAGSVEWLTTGAPAGFTYEKSGDSLLIKQAGVTVLTVTLNTATGAYAVTQNAAIDHPTGLNENNDSFTLNYQVADGDGDTAPGALTINVDDDTPVVLNKTDLIYANSSNPVPGGTGIFDYSIGADRRTSFSVSNSDFSTISLSGTVGTAAITAALVSWAAETTTSATFDIQFMYAANPLTPSVLTPAEGTLTFDKVSGTYTVTLDAPIKSLLTTSSSMSRVSYDLEGSPQPEIVVSKLAADFFVRFTGDEEAPGAPVDFTTSNGDFVFVDDERFVGEQTWVSISGTANGVASDTLQDGEILNMDFYADDPLGSLNPHVDVDKALASGIYLKLAQLGAGEDLVVILKLIDPDDNSETTRAIIVDAGDIFRSSESNPYDITFTDGSDGLVIIESNDYNDADENYQIYGAQLIVSTENITGSGIDLIRATGASGGSTGTQDFEANPGLGADTDDNDVIKIVDIGILGTSTQNANLDFSFQVVDADGDTTSTQLLEVAIVGGSTFTGTENAEVIQGSAGNDSLLGNGGDDILIGGLGNDFLSGGAGGDTFKWQLNETGTDTVTGFVKGLDHLDLSELLTHTDPLTPGDLTNYLSFSPPEASTNSTTITVDANGTVGGTAGPTIVLEGVNLYEQYTPTSAGDLIGKMLDDGSLVV
ncbi:retention module-containing protein [Pseudomonas sp.]|uniref:retention module-containing protein n=1 Tax=Pseudomonas sp. TaxID=306 RepID=UPI002737143B|nr:retention module-containing protein [Pseudomonas sp.]MDP3815556.1 retention module-containing protein [Pseudomonas sp.]